MTIFYCDLSRSPSLHVMSLVFNQDLKDLTKAKPLCDNLKAKLFGDYERINLKIWKLLKLH